MVSLLLFLLRDIALVKVIKGQHPNIGVVVVRDYMSRCWGVDELGAL
jgi:hypothetical protein